ncbi:hypothetical protein O181_036554 [Austropuccinia psidii MF-1]|uniref:Uncharacterized protein n=1 Tax=Austropuccinia psidii MF-1 TaxID=1389203 RepID=A0A9Q3HBN7_9BASI|nr:hypothetical protein [Austropuccinia psidii MF-1]
MHYLLVWMEQMDFSRLFPTHQPRKNVNLMPPPPPTGQSLHDQHQLPSPISETNKLITFLKEALSSKNPSQILNEEQIKQLLTQAEHINTLLQQQEERDQIESQKSGLDLIMRCLDSLEQQTLKVQVTPVQVSTSKTWASTASKTKIEGKAEKNLPEPSLWMLNEFKPATIVIQTPPGFTGFDLVSPSNITNMINKVLSDLGASVDSKKIEV